MSINGISAASAAAFLRQAQKPSAKTQTATTQTPPAFPGGPTAQQADQLHPHRHRHGDAGAGDLMQTGKVAAKGGSRVNTIA